MARNSKKIVTVQETKPVAKETKDNALVFTPKYKDDKSIAAAVDKVLILDKDIGQQVHDIITSCIAHDEKTRETGGSLTTVMNGTLRKLRASTSLDINAIMRYLQAFYTDKLTWDKKENKLRAKGVKFTATIVQPVKPGSDETATLHYSELPFWKLALNQAIRNEPWSFIQQLESLLNRVDNPEMLARLGKKGENAFSAQTERDVAIAVRELFGLVKPDKDKKEVDKAKVKELTTFASIAKDNPQALHDAATRH